VTSTPSRTQSSSVESPNADLELGERHSTTLAGGVQAVSESDNNEKNQTTNRIDIHLVDIAERVDGAGSTERENAAMAARKHDDIANTKDNAPDLDNGATADPGIAIGNDILSSPLSDSNKDAGIGKRGAANDHAFDDTV